MLSAVLFSIIALVGAASKNWPQETVIVPVDCTGFSSFSDCTWDWSVVTDLSTKVQAMHTELVNTADYMTWSVPSWESAPGNEVCREIVKDIDGESFEQCMELTYFMDFYSNSTFGTFENEDVNLAGMAIGVIPKETEEFEESLMDALRDVTVILDVQQTGVTKYRVITVLGTAFVNFLTVHDHTETDLPCAFAYTNEVVFTLLGGNIGNYVNLWSLQAGPNRLPGFMAVRRYLTNHLFNISPAVIKADLDSFYATATIDPESPGSDEGMERNYCASLSENLVDNACNVQYLPAIQYTLVDLLSPGSSQMYYTRYRSWTDISCQYQYAMNMDGTPKLEDGRNSKYSMVQNGDNFMKISTIDVDTGDLATTCDVGINTTYILYEFETYAAPYGMLSGFKPKDQNVNNLYAGLRVWPSRRYNTVVVSAVQYSEDADFSSEKYICRTQKCTNVFSDGKQQHIAGCVDVQSPWDTGVFVGSLIGIVIVIAAWVLGGLYAKRFERQPPEYYTQLVQYEPRVIQLKKEKAEEKARRKAEKKAAKSQKREGDKLLADGASSEESYTTD